MLHCFKILIFILFFDFIFSEKNILIKEGKVDVHVESWSTEKITFTAVENGTFLILFGVNATIIEATGNVSNDIFTDYDPYSSLICKTKVYAQNFIEGDYFTIYYPSQGGHILIKKMDAQFSLLQYTYNTFSNIFYDNCQHPLYIFATNDKTIHNKNEYSAYIQNHFGEVKASYLKECFNRDLDFEDDSLFSEMKNDSLTNLPICDLNLIKLKCNQPSLFSFYLAKQDIFSLFADLKVVKQPLACSAISSIFQIRFFYYQFFNILGNTTVDFTQFGHRIYNGEDFYLIYNYLEDAKGYEYRISNNSGVPSLALSVEINGKSNYKLAKENEKTLYNNKFIIKLDPNKKQKYIKIISTIKTFYFRYIFSQTEDLNYLPCRGIYNYGHAYITYLNNPYHYNNKKTKYHWFIVIHNYYGNEQYFTYQYTNNKWEDENEEEKDEEKGNDNEEKGNDNEEKGTNENIENNTKSSFASAFAWIVVILIIGTIIVFAYFYLYKRKNTNTTTNDILLNRIENTRELDNIN